MKAARVLNKLQNRRDIQRTYYDFGKRVIQNSSQISRLKTSIFCSDLKEKISATNKINHSVKHTIRNYPSRSPWERRELRIHLFH